MTSLAWEGCLNVRDLGGLPTEDGRRTRLGGVVRADNIRKLTDDGWRALADHGVQRIVDLRWPEELAEDQPRDVDIEVVHVSVLGEEYDAEYVKELDAHLMQADDVADHYAWSYVDFLERYRERFGRAFAAVAEADGTVVVHCMGGKDRTGNSTSAECPPGYGRPSPSASRLKTTSSPRRSSPCRSSRPPFARG